MSQPVGRDPKQRLRMLSLASRQVVRAIMRAASRDEVLNSFARLMVEYGGFAMAVVAWHNPLTEELVPVAHFGDSTGYLDRIHMYADRRPEGMGPAGMAFREGRPSVINNFMADTRTSPWWEQARNAGWHSSAAIPFQLNGKPVGMLGVYALEIGYFGPDEVELMEEVALDVGFALENLEREDERHRIEAALTQSEGRLSQAIRVANIGIFEYPHSGDGIYGSLEFRAVHGIGPDEPITTGMAAQIIHPEDRERVLGAYADAHHPDSGGLFDQEYRLLLPDGQVKWIRTRSQIFFEGEAAARHPVRTVGALTEITPQKQAQEEQTRLEARLAQSQKMESIGRLAGGVAHDFNNMLTVILGYASLSKIGIEPGDPHWANLTEIEKAANRSIEMTQQLLGFSRQQVIAPTPVNLNHLVADLHKPLSRLIGEDIDLTFLPGNDLWMVVVDPSQINRILLNLVANARDAMPAGGKLTLETQNVTVVEEYARVQPGATPGNHVMISVSDTGAGIPPDALPHIFEPFFTTKGQGKGTGLGLANVYGIVNQNQGFITVYSEAAHGTTFKIYLPQLMGSPQLQQQVLQSNQPIPGRGTVLLVEDDELVRAMTTMVLEKIGYVPLVAKTPYEALDFCAQPEREIRLMLTDVVMPGMNGLDLRERARILRPDLKVLFMSGYTSNVIVNHGVLKPGVQFVQKPFGFEELARALEQTLVSDENASHP